MKGALGFILIVGAIYIFWITATYIKRSWKNTNKKDKK